MSCDVALPVGSSDTVNRVMEEGQKTKTSGVKPEIEIQKAPQSVVQIGNAVQNRASEMPRIARARYKRQSEAKSHQELPYRRHIQESGR